MPPPVTTLDLITARWAAAPARAGTTRVLAVDGPSGSGKTTLAAALAGRPGGAPVVHLDDLYPGWDGLEDAVPRLLEWVLRPLAAGLPARYRRFDWVEHRYAEWHELPASAQVVVEGVSCGALACAQYLSLLVWVEAPRDVRFARGIARDGEGYRPHWERWAAQEERHFAVQRTRDRADLLIDGTDHRWGGQEGRGTP